jgi:Xaa-Pro aminopeptidase
MLTAEGCRRRRRRLLDRLGPLPDGGPLRLADPIHLMYLANFHVDPFSLGAGFGGLLELHADGRAELRHDDRLPASVGEAHADTCVVVPWYDAREQPARGPRQLALADGAYRVHDRPGDPDAAKAVGVLAALRRQKDPDEVDLLRRCVRAGEAGHAWARAHVRPGMTELEVYCGVSAACTRAAGRAVIVYGDFAVSPGPERHGGPPTGRVLESGDLMILDFSVVIGGYRGDFTNTLCVGRAPAPDQRRIYDLCLAALAAGEGELRAGRACREVYAAVRDVFDRAGVAEHFPHHAGHGLGLTHPESPFFVRAADEVLLAGDVVTLEPGLYVPGVGGVRLEHNYHVTAGGCSRLTSHELKVTE